MGKDKRKSYSAKQFSQKAQERTSAGEPEDEISILRSARELTTQEAAEILNISCHYLGQLLNEGIIPSRTVGLEHRVSEGDVMRYKQAEKQRQSRCHKWHRQA